MPTDGLTLPAGGFRAVSVVRGSGVVQIGSCRQAVSAHDHFGVPAAVTAKLRATGPEPLVILDAVFQTRTTDSAAGGLAGRLMLPRMPTASDRPPQNEGRQHTSIWRRGK